MSYMIRFIQKETIKEPHKKPIGKTDKTTIVYEDKIVVVTRYLKVVPKTAENKTGAIAVLKKIDGTIFDTLAEVNQYSSIAINNKRGEIIKVGE